jgi:hypothetical protein
MERSNASHPGPALGPGARSFNHSGVLGRNQRVVPPGWDRAGREKHSAFCSKPFPGITTPQVILTRLSDCFARKVERTVPEYLHADLVLRPRNEGRGVLKKD